jgi:HSP20 family protein
MSESQVKEDQQQGQQTGSQREGAQGSQSAGGRQQQDQQSGAVQEHRPGALAPLARYAANPFAMLQQLFQEADQLTESLLYGAPRGRRAERARAALSWVPEIEVRERDNQLLVRVDVPGVSKGDLKVDVQDRVLIVEGERREERTEGDQKQGFRRTEREYGSFYRAIPLPEGAEAEKAEARMKDGVLEITIPLSEEKKAKRLEIKE